MEVSHLKMFRVALRTAVGVSAVRSAYVGHNMAHAAGNGSNGEWNSNEMALIAGTGVGGMVVGRAAGIPGMVILGLGSYLYEQRVIIFDERRFQALASKKDAKVDAFLFQAYQWAFNFKKNNMPKNVQELWDKNSQSISNSFIIGLVIGAVTR
jgi:hypothetical protein